MLLLLLLLLLVLCSLDDQGAPVAADLEVVGGLEVQVGEEVGGGVVLGVLQGGEGIFFL